MKYAIPFKQPGGFIRLSYMGVVERFTHCKALTSLNFYYDEDREEFVTEASFKDGKVFTEIVTHDEFITHRIERTSQSADEFMVEYYMELARVYSLRKISARPVVQAYFIND